MKKWYTLLWLLLVLLFSSGFFFLEKEPNVERSIPGELPTLTVSEDDLIAIRLNHEATRFKVEQLKQEKLSSAQLEQELEPYMGAALIRQTIKWMNGEDEPELESFIAVDPVNPVVSDEFQEGLVSIIWDLEKNHSVSFIYSKPGDRWLLEHIEGGSER